MYYVGYTEASLVAFESDTEPTQASHGDRFFAVMGPFKTQEAAEFMAKHGRGNPHCGTVADVERIVRQRKITR